VTKAIVRREELMHKRALDEQRGATRSEHRNAQRETQPRLIPVANDVMVDLARREIWRAEASSPEDRVKLTPTEAKLLKVLIENRGQVLTHRDLVLLVQGYDVTDWEAPEVLRPLVSRLRQKLNNFEQGASWIVNVRGTGYVLERRVQDYGPYDGVERRQNKAAE
jgi:two-component system KDP operon response regulator KdpE